MPLNPRKNRYLRHNPSLKSESNKRIQFSCLSISSLPGSALIMHVESLGKPHDSTGIVKALSGKLDIKRQSPSILYVCDQKRPLSQTNPWYLKEERLEHRHAHTHTCTCTQIKAR